MAHRRMPAGRGIMGEITIRQPQPRKDRQRQRQSSLSVMNAGDQACPETRPCPYPSPGDRKPALTLAGKAHGTDVLLGKDRKSTRLNSSHSQISYAVFCLKKKKTQIQ